MEGPVAGHTGDSVGGWARWRPWLVAILALWLAASIVLVNWANQNGLLQDISFSPYHLPGYAAVLVLAIYVIGRVVRRGRQHGWGNTLPAYYGGLGLGLVLIAGWILLDIAWRNTLGIQFGIENGIAPPRLLLPAALIAIAAGPVREALAGSAGGVRSHVPAQWAAVLATGVIGAALTLVAFNPLRDGFQDYRQAPGRDVSEIWTMAADGTDQRRVIQAHGDGIDFSLPVFAPDGGHIAYTRWKNERNETANAENFDQTASIWVASANGQDARVLVDGAPDQAWTPAWSPDGKWIAYTLSPQASTTTQAGGPQAGDAPGQLAPPAVRGSGELWIVAADGTAPPRRLSKAGQEAVAPAWSPDSASIAFETNTGESSDIHVAGVAADGFADEHAIAANASREWGPTWSPDGRSIAFVSDRSGNEEIWTTAVDGSGTPTQLTNDDAGDWVPAFSPDGRRIAFVSDRSGDAEVWSMAADGSDLRDLSNHPGYIDGQWSVSWSPDGSRLAYAMAPLQPPESSFLARNDYAAAEALLYAISLALVAILLVAFRAPFGSFTLVSLVIAALSVAATEGWEYLPAAVAAGALVDLLVRSSPVRRRAEAAAAALPALSILAIGITLGLAQSLAWSLTVLLGLATAGALIGWALAYAVERMFRVPVAAGATAGREG